MKIRLLINIFMITGLFLFIGCSGGDSNSVPTSSTNTIEGKVIDGYINKSTVFIDNNNNNVADTDEYQTTTNYSGYYKLDIDKSVDISNIKITAIGGYDIDSDKYFNGALTTNTQNKDSNGKLNITPMSSIVENYIYLGLSIEAAQIKTAEMFNVTKEDVVKDPVTEFSTNEDLYRKNRAILEFINVIIKKAPFSEINYEVFMTNVFKELIDAETNIDDFSKFNYNGIAYNFEDIRLEIEEKISTLKPANPETKYTTFEIENQEISLTDEEFFNFEAVKDTSVFEEPGDVEILKDIYGSKFQIRDGINKFRIGTLYNYERYFDGDKWIDNTDNIIWKTTLDGIDIVYLFKNSVIKRTGNTPEEWVYETISDLTWNTPDDGRQVAWLINMLDYNAKYILIGLYTSIDGNSYQSGTVYINKETFEIKKLKNTLGQDSTIIPFFKIGNEGKIIAQEEYDMYSPKRTIGTYSIIETDTGLVLEETSNFFVSESYGSFLNTIFVNDYDNDNNLEIIFGLPPSDGSLYGYKYFCSYETDTLTPCCFDSGVLAFNSLTDTKYQSFKIESQGSCVTYIGMITDYINGQCVTEVEKKVATNTYVTAKGFTFDNKQSLIKSSTYECSSPAENKIIKNFNLETFVEAEEYIPTGGYDPDYCTTSYPGDLKDEPQLVGQCQAAYFYACNKKIYAADYPEKIPEFDLRIKTYCEILDGYQEFSDDSSNPKDSCSACSGF